MKRLTLLLFLARSAFAILPLPYSADPVDDEPKAFLQTVARDIASIPAYQDLKEGSSLREM